MAKKLNQRLPIVNRTSKNVNGEWFFKLIEPKQH
jgi:hypothetical protein